MVEYRVSPEEADNFLRQSQKKGISDFSRGSKKPISFNQSVSVQDSRSLYRPGPGDQANILGEDENENKEPTVSRGEEKSKLESKGVGQEMEKDKTTVSGGSTTDKK